MTTDNPINLRLKSFARFDDAMIMCDLLNKETGDEYTVVSDNHLGFTARRCQENRQKQQQNPVETYDHNNSAYRQAFRGFIPHYSEITIGILLIANPYAVLGWIFALLNIQTIPEWGEGFRLGGFLLLLYGLRFIYSYYAIKLWFDGDGVVLKKGIIAQDQIQIRFGDIKTIGVHQSIINRLLGIGTLHLDSAGTNGTVDIVFNNLIDPVYMRRRIQHLIDQSAKR
ncbi:PH domain-containing protein [Methylophaga sp.]|uniref:PH domain-containing protein n=1 Tax=Methylophaga sp. TaxID=2024840 RepID=UPI002727E977|nr:PH domain-containing protein [Methylophaga sp.]MDO8826057.1 PH domain-containing protein [Methylophaga sp.]